MPRTIGNAYPKKYAMGIPAPLFLSLKEESTCVLLCACLCVKGQESKGSSFEDSSSPSFQETSPTSDRLA
jgi:hypothetical protein